jgi:hypothetical protein
MIIAEGKKHGKSSYHPPQGIQIMLIRSHQMSSAILFTILLTILLSISALVNKETLIKPAFLCLFIYKNRHFY